MKYKLSLCFYSKWLVMVWSMKLKMLSVFKINKKIKIGFFKFLNLILAMSLLGLSIDMLPIATASETGKFIGKVYSFGSVPGFSFSDKKRIINPEYLQILFINDKYFLLAKENKEQHAVVVDAASIPKDQFFVGRPIEDECTSPMLPEEIIFVISKWVNRKLPTGEFDGGYAYSITKAWRVNFEDKKLEEIPVDGIKCNDNRTDADVN